MISETFTFPEWVEAIQSLESDGLRADRAFAAALRAHQPVAATDALQLLALPAPGVEPFAVERAVALARLANDQLAAHVRRSAGRIQGLATVSVFDPQALREAQRAVTELGLAGISLGSNRGMRLDHPSLLPLFAFAESAGVPVYLPAAYAPLAGDAPYRAAGRAGVITGAAADSGQHLMQLIYGGVFDRHPRIKVVAGRLGEGTPYWYGHVQEVHEAMAGAGRTLPARKPDEYFGRNILLTTADMSADTLRFCSTMLGEGSVMRADWAAEGAMLAEARRQSVNARGVTRVDASVLLRRA
jgi:predicted TIM-barrel fold metal-dependent hydrolase